MENHHETTIDTTSSIIMNDYCVAEVLKYLNFNEKLIFRSVTHQFKRVIDSFVPKTLV